MHCNDNSLENYAPKIRCGYGRRSPKRSLETREKFSHSREFKVHGNGIEPVGTAAVADVRAVGRSENMGWENGGP